MAGRSRNTLSNVGTGLSAALPSYQQSMERLNTQEMQAMRDQIDLARQMEQDRLAQANSERQLEQSQPGSVIARKRAEWVAAGRDPSDPAFQNWALGLTTAEAAPSPAQEVELKRQAWIAAGGDPEDVAGFQEYALGVKPAGTSAADQRLADSAAIGTDVIITAAGIAREKSKDPNNVGVFGALAGFNPETDAAELRRQIGVLTSNASIENLTAMRQESPTGAALGVISDKDTSLLSAAAGALDPNAKQEDFQKALDNYELTLLRIIHGYEAGDSIFVQTREGFEPPTPTEPALDPELESILELHGVPL